MLDRLNALLEDGGVLTVDERGHLPNGQSYTIVPHPNFRVFMTVDPRYGELSRPMRNRGNTQIWMNNSQIMRYKMIILSRVNTKPGRFVPTFYCLQHPGVELWVDKLEDSTFEQPLLHVENCNLFNMAQLLPTINRYQSELVI